MGSQLQHKKIFQVFHSSFTFLGLQMSLPPHPLETSNNLDCPNLLQDAPQISKSILGYHQ
eukprot:9588894-Ditylum_brightwellii.AAC.1